MLVGSEHGGLRRLLPGGGIDSSFSVTVNGRLNCIALQSDGRIILGGSFTTVNGAARAGLARLNPNGTLDTGFNPAVSAYDQVCSILVLPDDRFIVRGDFTSVGGLAAVNLARLSADGAPDSSFTASTSGTVYCLAAQRDGKVLVGGQFRDGERGHCFRQSGPPECGRDRPPHTPSPLHAQAQLDPHPSKAVSPLITPAEIQSSSGSSPSLPSAPPSPSSPSQSPAPSSPA